MGSFRVSIEIGDPQGQRYEPVEALVDTRASHTVVPTSLLRRLGVTVQWRWPFELADSREVERDVGFTWVRIDGRAASIAIVFGDEGVEPLLGASTLEVFNLGVDPVHRRLIPVPGLLKAVR